MIQFSFKKLFQAWMFLNGKQSLTKNMILMHPQAP